MILMIDNFDSFTYNLVQYFNELGAEVVVKRNDEVSIRSIKSLDPKHIVISPGPKAPAQAGISLDVIETFAGVKPILGVCLGHQAIAQVFGGSVIRAQKVMHGKTSKIMHKDRGVFAGLNNPLTVTRYHSLVVDRDSLPDCFEVTAWTEYQGEVSDKHKSKHNIDCVHEIMGISHKVYNLHGVQFHPEAILTEQGHQLLANFLAADSFVTK